MEPYTTLAPVYDDMLRHVDYNEWYKYLRTLMCQYIEKPGMVLEMGCGTGRFGTKFSRDDFPIYGMDSSLEMLQIARSRAFKNFQIFCADMRNFHLKRKFSFIFSVHDTMNYFLKESDLRKVFKSVKRIMDKESIFMFDITTEYNIKRFFDGKIMKYNIRGTHIEWSNYYDKRYKLVYSTLHFTGKDGKIISEKHVQRIYTVREIKSLLSKENLRVIDIFGDYTFSTPHRDTVMINFITRKI